MTNQPPSANPADESTFVGVLKTAMTKALQSQDDMMPVRLGAYDRATNRATVNHMIQMMGSDGEKVSRAPVPSVRTLQLGNAKYSVSLPLQPGDLGWLKAADRDISLFQQGLTEDAPNTARMHSFQDSLFIPDAMSNGAPPEGQEGRVVIGANDGSSFVAIDEETVELRVGTALFKLTAEALIIEIGGVSFNLGAAGMALTGGTLTMNGKNIGDTHVHSGVETGPNNTGAPI